MKLALFLAFKSIYRGNRWAAALIVAVMMLSFTNLILTPSIISGMTKTLNSQNVNTLYGNIIIDPASDINYLEQAGQIEQKLEQYPEVVVASAHLNSAAHT